MRLALELHHSPIQDQERGGKVSQADFQLGAGGVLYDSSHSLASVLNAAAGILKHRLEKRLAL